MNLLMYTFACLTCETILVFGGNHRMKVSQKHNFFKSTNFKKSELEGRTVWALQERKNVKSSSGLGSKGSRAIYKCHYSWRYLILQSAGKKSVYSESSICDIIIYFKMYIYVVIRWPRYISHMHLVYSSSWFIAPKPLKFPMWRVIKCLLLC